MEIIYNGSNPLAYHSAPSGNVYLFDPGIPQKVLKEDEKFFKGMAEATNSKWKRVTIAGKFTKGDGE